MSDLSLQLQQATSQLPVSSYFEEALFRREMATLFQRGPRYVGHELAVPNIGDFHALPQEGEGRALVRTPQGVQLVSNVCRHRQAVMLKGRGRLPGASDAAAGNIVCPLHRWTYAPEGQLLGAPHFRARPLPEPEQLPAAVVERPAVRGQRRRCGRRTGEHGPTRDLDFSGHVLDRIELHECNYNWKTFIEV